MRLDEIRELMAKDSVIDKAALDEESIKIPYLHSVWYGYLIDELKVLRGIDSEYNRCVKEKTEYYLGKAPDEVYKEKPLDLKILKQDVALYLDADTELDTLGNKRELQKIKVDTIDAFVKTLNQRSFMINNAIKFLYFKNGLSNG